MPGWLTEAWDRIVASDPALTRLRLAGGALVSMGSVLALEFGLATATHAGSMGAIIVMMLGGVLAMMSSMALAGQTSRTKIRTAVFFPVALGVGLLAGIAVEDHTVVMLTGFVIVMFIAVAVRRFGVPFFFYGFMGWMGYFFAVFLHATLGMLPQLMVAVVLATVWSLLLSITVLRTNPTRTVRRTVQAFDARARSLARACADLLEETSPGQRDRLRHRVHRRQTQLAEAALMVEAWSAEQNSLPAQRSASTLRRKLIDAQQLLDRMAGAASGLSDGDPDLVRAAAKAVDRLARHDDAGAYQAALALADVAERNSTIASQQRLAGWLPARQFSVAVLEFAALAEQATGEGDRADEFQPVVQLAMGALPGSPAVAADVPARGRAWNPLARLDLTTRQAIQASVASALAILLGWELSPQRYYWAVIAAFVMFAGTATRAETFLKGLNRVLGTLFGLVVAVWLAGITNGNGGIAVAIILASVFCGFYLFRVSYLYMIFFITIILGQLYAVLHEFSAELMLLRLEETAIGAVAGFVVAFVVAPLSTRDTVRTARDNLLTALADLLDAAADRLTGSRLGTETSDLDALTRTLDSRLWQLQLVARPLTRRLLWGNSPPRTRHRLILYTASTTHARALAVALRRPSSHNAPGLATACRAMALAVTQLTEIRPGRPQPAVAEPLRQASTALFSHAPATPAARATDPTIHALIHLHDLLQRLAVSPTQPAEHAGDAALAGTVTDATGEPLHARVVLLTSTITQRQVSSGYSDSDGHYHIQNCPPGDYLAVANATGHQPVVARITLQAGRTTSTDFTIAESTATGFTSTPTPPRQHYRCPTSPIPPTTSPTR